MAVSGLAQACGGITKVIKTLAAETASGAAYKVVASVAGSSK